MPNSKISQLPSASALEPEMLFPVVDTIISETQQANLGQLIDFIKDEVAELPNLANVDSFSAGTTGLLPNTPTQGNVVLSGTLSASNGGTGRNTLTSGSLLIGNNSNPVDFLIPGASGSLIISDGTSWKQATINQVDPNVDSFSAGTTGLLPNTPTTGPVVLSGTLSASSGGTGRNILDSGSLLVGNNGNAVNFLSPAGTSGSIIITDGTNWKTGSVASLESLDVDSFSAGTTGLLPNIPTQGNIILSGTLSASNGGTGRNTLDAGSLIVGNNGNAVNFLSPIGPSGSLIISDGTSWKTGSVNILESLDVDSFSGGDTGLLPNIPTQGNVVLSGTLSASSGGTGRNTLMSASFLVGNGTSSVEFLSPGVNGTIIISDGINWKTGNITSIESADVDSFSGGTTGLTPSVATTGAVTLGGTLSASSGGTGRNTLTSGSVLLGNNGDGLLTVVGTLTGQVLKWNGTSWAPDTDNNSGGTVTSIATNNGITGGTITTFGTIGLTGQALSLHNFSTNASLFYRNSAGNIQALQATAGNNGQVIKSNGTDWIIAADSTGGATATPGTPFNSIQFNDGGNFGGDSDLLWNKNTNNLTLNGTLNNITVSGNTDLGNTIVGFNALTGGTGGENVAIGQGALGANDIGGANTIIGYSALNNNLFGDYNTVIGNRALSVSTGSSYNVAIGAETLDTLDSGSKNIVIGHRAGNMLDSANGNVLIGYEAGQDKTQLDNNIIIKTENGPKIVTDNSGNLSIGKQTLQNVQYIDFSNSGINNIALGESALSGNTGGSYNLGIGYRALRNNTLGDSNTAFGNLTLSSLETGSSNIAIGNSALIGFVSGNNNIAIGTLAGFTFGSSGSGNIFLGDKAGFNQPNLSDTLIIKPGTIERLRINEIGETTFQVSSITFVTSSVQNPDTALPIFWDTPHTGGGNILVWDSTTKEITYAPEYFLKYPTGPGGTPTLESEVPLNITIESPILIDFVEIGKYIAKTPDLLPDELFGPVLNFSIQQADNPDNLIGNIGFYRSVGGAINDGTFSVSTALGGVLKERLTINHDGFTKISGTLAVTSWTSGNVVVGNGDSDVQLIAPGTSGNVLTSNGITWISAAPTGGGGGTSNSATPVSTTQILGTTHNIILASAPSGDIILTLPSASADPYREYMIKKVDNNSNKIIVSGSGGETIDGLTGRALNVQYESLTIVNDGTSGWFIV